MAAALAVTLALAGCSGGSGTEPDGSDASQDTTADQGADSGNDGDTEAADDADTDAGDDDAGDDGAGAADDAVDDDDGQDPVAIDGCPVASETVSDIVDSALVAGEPQDTIGDGVTCAYLHETDLYPSAAVTVGNWDGTEESRDSLIDNNVERFGEPTGTPSDLGEHAFLWNESEEQTTLIVFDAGRYYTTTTNGIDDVDRSRDIVVSLYEAAP